MQRMKSPLNYTLWMEVTSLGLYTSEQECHTFHDWKSHKYQPATQLGLLLSECNDLYFSLQLCQSAVLIAASTIGGVRQFTQELLTLLLAVVK